MLEIQIIKIEDPGCLWGRVLKGPSIQPDNPEEYENLTVKMNLFYHEVDLDVQKIKPTELKEGLVCVVFSPDLKSWCRAVVESVFQGTAGGQALCLLVDHGDRIITRAEDVRTPLEKFLQLPFRVRRFKLSGIRPVTLQLSISNEMAKLVPSSTWDSSATKYLHNLLQVSTLVEAVLCETHAGCSSIELYLTIKNTKICVNHELVVKKFACFMSEKSSAGEGSMSGDHFPVSLAWDIYSSPYQLLEMNGCCPVKAPPPDILIRKEWKDEPQTRDDLKDSLKEMVQQKPQVSAETHKPSQVKSQVPKLTCNSGTYTIGRGWRIRAEATDIFTDESFSQTDANNSQYMKFLNTVSHSKRIPKSDKERQTSTDQTESKNSITSTPDSEKNQEAAALSEEPSLEDQIACSRLLQFLNPEPLNPNQDHVDTKVVRCDQGHSGVLVHTPLPVNPCSRLARAPISKLFKKFLMWKKYSGPNVAESYCWPAVARGCDTVLVSQSADNPLSYIPPLLMLLQMVSVSPSLAACTGPIAVILCPGWEKVQMVLELLEDSKATRNLHPTSVLLGLDQDEPKKAKIQRNCLLLVTTPFTIMRLLDAQCFLFLRLCHLVLDEADVLYSQAPEQMYVILKHFQKVVSGEERSSCPRQIIAVGSRWSAGMESLVREHMIYPCIIITVMEEAALYGRVHQRVQLCLDCDKISVLLGSLDFHPPKPQKTLIITNSAEETEHVYKAVVNAAIFTLKAHEGMTYQFDFVIDQWRKDIGPGTQVILVTTNNCLKALGIRDATCVVHYGFPSSPKLFGSRLFCMSENFRNVSEPMPDHAEGSSPAAQSVLLLSEQNARHVCGVLKYLRRAGALLPPELLQFALGVQQAKEEQKTDRPLCCSLKSFGFCRDSTVCPDRHMINISLDHPLHPDSGTVMVLPLNIKTANVYFGRIVKQNEDCYETLAAQMNIHYASERRCAVEVLEGELYAIQEESVYNRVRVTEVPEKGEQLFSSVTAYFIDEGRTQEVKSHQLLQLPTQFQELPGQAVEIILCRVQPIDGEVDWNPKVTRAISLKIKGKLHQARVVMCVGNAVWVDPMVRMTRVPGLKTYINEYNVHTEILNFGFGVNNPQHLELLKSVFQGEENSSILDQLLTGNSSESSSVCSQQRVEVTEGALTSRMRDTVSSHTAVELSETSKSVIAAVCNGAVNNTDSDSSEENMNSMSPSDLNGLSSPNQSRPTSPETDEFIIRDDVLNAKKLQTPKNLKNSGIFSFQPTSFHPQIKWFQRNEFVTVYVKLINPVMQKCEFFSDTIIYSGYVNDRHYYAKLELFSDIIAKECSWKMKCNEPVMKLIKKEKRDWKTLLKQKSAFVSYEFEYIDEAVVSTVNGQLFLAQAGEEGCYVSSESDSD
ncbi:putative ATP-dependent RNA helicase TDRD12 [Myxocyprinus asiaticus]|uniref:putative ATP-dependent RNA helicase TDRD12 n=1 Tax=Myxocyprinus asiaticus TaxID=70543 RepID=UPI002222DB2F|nr:putative ATP-dependent RNA helicase TDRD12 [Myxocyprinus asiaticus]